VNKTAKFVLLANAISQESFVEARDAEYGKISFESCCVDSKYSTTFLNYSIVDVGLLDSSICVRVKKQELRNRER